MRLQREQNGYGIIVPFVVLVIVLAIIAVVVIAPLLTQEERAKICSGGVNEASRKWLEVVVDRTYPEVTRIDVLPKSYIDMIYDSLNLVDTLDVLYRHEGKDHTIGKTQIFELGERVFANVVFFGQCTLQYPSAQSYRGETIENLIELSILIGLMVASPEVVAFLTTFEIVLGFLFTGSEYNLDDASLNEGVEISGLEEGDYPSQLNGKEKDAYLPVG